LADAGKKNNIQYSRPTEQNSKSGLEIEATSFHPGVLATMAASVIICGQRFVN